MEAEILKTEEEDGHDKAELLEWLQRTGKAWAYPLKISPCGSPTPRKRSRPPSYVEEDPSVRGDGGWYTQAGHPPGHKSVSTSGDCIGGQLYNLHPAFWPVNEAHHIGMAAWAAWERAHQVSM